MQHFVEDNTIERHSPASKSLPVQLIMQSRPHFSRAESLSTERVLRTETCGYTRQPEVCATWRPRIQERDQQVRGAGRAGERNDPDESKEHSSAGLRSAGTH